MLERQCTQKMKNKRYFLKFCLGIIFFGNCVLSSAWASCYRYTQLPLSDSSLSEFPEINSTCFVIVSSGTKLAIHEKNSIHKIEIDTKHGKRSLREMVELNIESLNTRSNISGITHIFTYKNANNCTFKVAMSGLKNQYDVEMDASQIKNWLDQLFEQDIYKEGDHITNIPVLYGEAKNKFVSMNINSDCKVVLSSKQQNRIVKNIVYKIIAAAPINHNTFIGTINISTALFKNPISTNIYSTQNINKASRLSVTCDSIKYLIFGAHHIQK